MLKIKLKFGFKSGQHIGYIEFWYISFTHQPTAWLIYCTILHTATDDEIVSTHRQSSDELPSPLLPVSNVDESPQLDHQQSFSRHAAGIFLCRVCLI